MRTNVLHEGQYYPLSCRRRIRTCFRLQGIYCKALSQCQRRWNSSGPDQPSSNGRVIFSGIQPTGIPHLGNYLGALREWVRLQNEATGNTKLFFSIADLHSLTVPQEAARLREWRKQSFATLLAVGLEPARCVLFHQSAVSHNAHLSGPAVATLFIA